MKIYTKLQFQMLPNNELMLLEAESYDYSGPLAQCDRWAQGAAQNATNNAENVAAQTGANAESEEAAVTPFLQSEMKATHGFTPGQTNELLTNELSGLGAASGAADEQAKLQGMRTRNASGFTKALDENSRNRMKAAAAGSEGIAAQDVMQAKQENQEGAAGLQGLFGENLGAQEKAMGNEANDIEDEVKAGQSGWLQNLTGVLSTLNGSASAAMQGYKLANS